MHAYSFTAMLFCVLLILSIMYEHLTPWNYWRQR